MNKGNEKFQNEEYTKALDYYRAAYQLYPSPKILFNIAQVAEITGDDMLATENYEAFLKSDFIQEIPINIQNQARASLEGLAQKLATIVISGSPVAATVKIDGQVRGDLQGGTFRVKVGKRALLVEHPDYIAHRQTILAEGLQEYKLQVRLSTNEKKTLVAASVKTPIYKELWFWGTVSAVVLVGTGAALAVDLAAGSAGSEHVESSWENWESL